MCVWCVCACVCTSVCVCMCACICLCGCVCVLMLCVLLEYSGRIGRFQHPVLLLVCPQLCLCLPLTEKPGPMSVQTVGSPSIVSTTLCTYLLGTTWLLHETNVQPTLGSGNDISVTATTSMLMFTQFDAAVHLGSYQC